MRIAALWFVAAVMQAADPVSLRVAPGDRTLHGSGAMQQYVAIATYADGSETDVTDAVQWKVSNAEAAEVAGGLVKARRDGKVRVVAQLGAREAGATVTVNAGAERPFTFQRDIGAILTRAGCNGSSCHGGVKGRGGFKLSSGALHPKDDYEWIVKGGVYQVLTSEAKGERVPRIDLKQPEQSMLLRKPTGQAPHGGGVRFKPDSAEYQALLEWIRKGAPYGPDDTPEAKVTRLEVFPKIVSLERGGKHRLLVTAHLADGRTEDFTRAAVFSSNDADVVKVSEDGIVTPVRLGETAIVVRAAGGVASATVGVIGPAVASFPAAPKGNFIDELVWDKLRRFRIPPSAKSSDAEFVRRVALDLTGTLPPPARAREFIASRDPAKREKLIDTLLRTPEFVEYWTYRFDDVFRVAVFSNGIQPKWSQMYGEWVRAGIATNKPYDQMARERLT
ncbi:MAG: DUF1549 domain-containing protein, partial [Bryobacterales bacterium]|nr:DUF1549 domain-containing protein [Bryobacterales bacterium]